jgi:hypothetical protein
MANVYIVYGPQGTGKSLHKDAIAKVLGCAHIHDGPEGEHANAVRFVSQLNRVRTPGNHLVLTSLTPSDFSGHTTIDHHMLPIADALRMALVRHEVPATGDAELEKLRARIRDLENVNFALGMSLVGEARAVPPPIVELAECRARGWHDSAPAYRSGWNDCRLAMMGQEPVGNTDSLAKDGGA